ncbi:hypothetical protein BN59_00744 [Legionella massiliensis]|uniref:Uncharacterized protein n=1 Tax=Legionella massiliensis TaxID=1034943 RepID=A0A078KQ32_9GAMM|nr:hypothetical protein [Legionella massiliensis]CDZ76475.1 hypothetical protein BN59_00744 [Legionella massiliensis]CEE12213.1 hypothetical protein BN1094_00744 [Legionella massiliensis]
MKRDYPDKRNSPPGKRHTSDIAPSPYQAIKDCEKELRRLSITAKTSKTLQAQDVQALQQILNAFSAFWEDNNKVRGWLHNPKSNPYFLFNNLGILSRAQLVLGMQLNWPYLSTQPLA